MKVFNMTPHAITVRKPNGETMTIEPCGKVFRLIEVDHEFLLAGENPLGVDLIKRSFLISWGEFLELTDPEAIVIVSLPALMALRQAGPPLELKALVVAPDTGSGAIRDKRGNIIGTTRFIVL